jgi:catechol 2,3-dioxygenase-like lactoylglutathione lyase family enzyme
MGEVESLSHTAILVPDIREAEEFYEQKLGARIHNRISLNADDIRRGRGSPHTCWTLGDYLIVFFLPDDKEGRQPGHQNGFHHGFAVSRERFSAIVDRLREDEFPFDGPVLHPETGPLGESIFLEDTGGNRLEVCWRRDTDRKYNPVIVADV